MPVLVHVYVSRGYSRIFYTRNSLSTVDRENRDLEKDFENIEITFHI